MDPLTHPRSLLIPAIWLSLSLHRSNMRFLSYLHYFGLIHAVLARSDDDMNFTLATLDVHYLIDSLIELLVGK
jgi:hypothetical protein